MNNIIIIRGHKENTLIRLSVWSHCTFSGKYIYRYRIYNNRLSDPSFPRWPSTPFSMWIATKTTPKPYYSLHSHLHCSTVESRRYVVAMAKKNLEESDVGINCYVSSLPGFRAILKQRSQLPRSFFFFSFSSFLLLPIQPMMWPVQVCRFYRARGGFQHEGCSPDVVWYSSRGIVVMFEN